MRNPNRPTNHDRPTTGEILAALLSLYEADANGWLAAPPDAPRTLAHVYADEARAQAAAVLVRARKIAGEVSDGT